MATDWRFIEQTGSYRLLASALCVRLWYEGGDWYYSIEVGSQTVRRATLAEGAETVAEAQTLATAAATTLVNRIAAQVRCATKQTARRLALGATGRRQGGRDNA